MTRRPFGAWIAIVIAGIAAAYPAEKAALSNERIVANFGERGLISLEDKKLQTKLRLTSDEFSVTVDGTTVDSESLQPSIHVREADRVVFRYKSGAFSIEAVYGIKPGWHFVSKQLFITATPHARFRVDGVEVFRSAPGEPIQDARIPRTSRPRVQAKDYGAFLRLSNGRGIFALVQNPFLEVGRTERSFSIRYAPDMEWRSEDGPYASDRGCLGLYRLAGYEVPRPMIPEWKLVDSAAHTQPGLDSAEIEAFTGCVRAFLLYRPQMPVRMFVGWCVNDYQIDAGTAEGRSEYKRIIDRAAELGAQHVLYAPTNSLLSRREESADSWHWENLLWLGLGQKIRKNEWNPKIDPIPASIEEMLHYAKGKGVKLVAYVYPVLPFSQNPDWLVQGNPGKNASLGFRSLQDYLIENLVTFARRTGLGGYAFDYTFLSYPGTSRYAQWWGWRRVLETLRRELPDIVIDGRQSYQEYGPWIWLAGSYPHPTGTDEQPESFVNFPDLHFDRVSADRQRYTAYWYRNFEFCPSEIVPGFITHQTGRNDDSGDMPRLHVPGKTGEALPLKAFRQRDWDYLGWRYSLISSLATAGWNNVINMIPARDPEEYRNFSNQDLHWFRKWLDWADANREILRHTRTLPGEPAIGKVDGTAAVADGRGFIFLFNPNSRALTAEFALDRAIGLEETGRFLLKEIYALGGRLIGKPGAGVWSHGDRVSLPIDGTSAVVLELIPFLPCGPLLFNAPGAANLVGGTLRLTGVRGEAGTQQELLVLLPTGSAAKRVTVNGIDMNFRQEAKFVRIPIHYAGKRFSRNQPLASFDPAFTGDRPVTGAFRIPARIFDQLAARRKAWPIPWTQEDLRSTWLAPERLLLHIQIAEPSDKMMLSLMIDGRRVDLKKAYSSVQAYDKCFTGFYADLSSLPPDKEHEFSLSIPLLKPGQFQGIFFENIETEFTDRLASPEPDENGDANMEWTPFFHFSRERQPCSRRDDDFID